MEIKEQGYTMRDQLTRARDLLDEARRDMAAAKHNGNKQALAEATRRYNGLSYSIENIERKMAQRPGTTSAKASMMRSTKHQRGPTLQQLWLKLCALQLDELKAMAQDADRLVRMSERRQ